MTPFRQFLLLLVVFVWTVQTVHAQPADSAIPALDCTFRGGNSLFAPQQSIILDTFLRPQAANTSPSKLRAILTDLSSPDRRVLAELNTQIPPFTPFPISFVTPEKEGVYEIVLSVELVVSRTPQINHPLQATPRQPALPVIEVRRQFVVLSPQVSSRPAGDWILSDTRCLLTPTADSPSRRQLFPYPKVGDLAKFADFPKITDIPKPANLLKHSPFSKPVASSSSSDFSSTGLSQWEYAFLSNSPGLLLDKSERHPGFSALPPAEIGGCTWHFLPMDTEIGKPYLVEIDYPSNIPQTFGLAVVERTGENGIHICAAATIHLAEEIVKEFPTETVATHQLLFWAMTKNPECVIVNDQPDKEALFRDIRISQVSASSLGDQRLPKLFEGTAQRKRIGQLFGKASLHGTTSLNTVNMTLGTIPDWQTDYEATSHLIDTLCRGGYDGLAMTVLAKDLYLPPTENGFFDQESEAARGIEMMFQRFDKEELTLIPAIQFDMSIPSLEQLLSQHPGIVEEIKVGNLYNILHPAVQQAMAEVVLQLADCFGQHPSFGGVALVLSPKIYAQLPFALYPPDDHTFAQFQQETEEGLGVPFPDEQHLRATLPTQQFLEQKNAGRMQFFRGNPKIWETWVRWRAAKVSGFYADLANQVSARRPDAPLYLLGGMMFDQPEIQDFCRPTLPKNAASLQALQLLGFDLPLIAKTETLHFLKPVQIDTVPISEGRYCSYEGLNTADTAASFAKSGIMPGVQFVHRDTDNFVTAQVHAQSRRRFVKQLAQADVFMFMDSGIALPFGQEPAMLDLLDTYRRLPAVPFQTFQSTGEGSPSLQPLTVRYKNLPEGVIVYIVNDAPFAVEADFLFNADSRSTMSELTGRRMIRSFDRRPQGTGSHTWRASLLPYDLLAVRISDPNTIIESVSVHCPPSLCGAEGAFKQKVEELTRRVHTARNRVAFDGLINADFELPPDAAGGIAGWQCFGKSLTAQLDQVAVCKGKSSVRLTSGSAEEGMFLSQPLTLPATGRLGVSMFVGVPEDCRSLPMSVVLFAKHRDKPFSRSVLVEEGLIARMKSVESKNGVRWHPLHVPFERMPLDSLEEVRIGIQYSGNGTVWIDDVTLYQVSFSAAEMSELQRLLIIADQRCTSGKVSDLSTQLESYWAHFLCRHVPSALPQPSVAASKPSVAKDVPAPPKPATWYQRAKEWAGWR
ncbi:MAG: hypothetical protein LBI05_10425 [Planctomycetaceae bacterium]|jgi:hypothetical protein|nr:hypothetical protein [Planctomycetaceae bacterium]